MVQFTTTTVIAVALLVTSATAQQPAGYRRWSSRSLSSTDSYLALREHFETQLGRELDPLEARDVAYLAERSWEAALAKKAARKLKKHHGKFGDNSGGSQEQDRRELVDSSVYAREYDLDTALVERGLLAKYRKWKQERKERKQAQLTPPETFTPRELSQGQSLYSRDFADFIHKFFHPYGDLNAKKDEKKEEPKEAVKTEDAPTDSGPTPAPDAAERSLYDDSMDVMTRSYYGFDDMD